MCCIGERTGLELDQEAEDGTAFGSTLQSTFGNKTEVPEPEKSWEAPGAHKEAAANDAAAVPQKESVIAKIKRSVSNISGGSKGAPKGTGSGGGPDTVVKQWSNIYDGTHNYTTQEHMVNNDERMLLVAGPREVQVSPATVNMRNRGKPNLVRTTKFTWATWIPLSLFYQFQRVANIYFLYIAVLVCFSWSPKNWKSKIFPFAFVLTWTAAKDMFEDMRRKRDDQAENGQKVKRLQRNPDGSNQDARFEEIPWAEVLAGDVLFIPENSTFPADLLLLHPAGGSEAFISTVMLDGETSLKVRMAPGICEVLGKKCAKAAPDAWLAAQAMLPDKGVAFPFSKVEDQIMSFMRTIRKPGLEIRYSAPTVVLSDVRGSMVPCGNDTEKKLVCPFTEENFLPRGCVLRNTPWLLAIAIYVGEDTKTRLNANSAKNKTSNMQILLNVTIRCQLVVLFCICIYATIMAFTVGATDVIQPAKNPIIRFFMFCVTFYHVVPLSLYVVYEVLKLVMGFQVNMDKQMEDPVTHQLAVARTAEVMEEMGQVNFIFSDKTGTLTANEMVFAKCHVGGKDIGDFRLRTATNGQDPAGLAEAKRILRTEADPIHKPMVDFFTCLAVCHSVQAAKQEDEQGKETITYSGSSPDEVALAEIARDVGIVFASRARQTGGSTSELQILGPGKRERLFVHLQELAFNSDRKRMSVLVKQEDQYILITKGADSAMEPLLTHPFTKECQNDLQLFSTAGLRTLVVAMKVVPKNEFEVWNAEYNAARNIIEDTKEKKLADLAARLEIGLTFVGLTAVEDRLQDGVPETITKVKEMGIRLWVLTGDKTETAIDIARSCMLFQDSTFLAEVLKANSEQEAQRLLEKACESLKGKADGGLVLDGQTLVHAMQNAECRKLIYDLGIASRSCVCSRLSPMQKLELVQLVRKQNPAAITLSIGDGANDVPMIQGAHVGVAIRGKEGTQSVQASDVAISQFRFLAPLLMCHGRRAYRRMSVFLCYYLYKNVALLMCDIVWMHQDAFRARIALPEYLSIGFNVAFSAWHLWIVLGFDRDLPDEVAMAHPELYKVGPDRALFNLRIFSKWMFLGVVHGIVSWIIPNVWYGGHDYSKAYPSDFWVGSTASFTSINVIVWIKLFMSIDRPFALTAVVPTICSILLYLLALAVISYTSLGEYFQPCMKKVSFQIVTNKNALATLFICPALALSLDVLEKLSVYFICPTQHQKVRRGW